jgi:predicted transcriptional regulator
VKNRSRVEILYDIVSASKESARKTHLMYKSNLSFKQLRLYLDFLLYRGLVEEKNALEEEGGRTYAATPKGIEFMRLFEDLQGFLGASNAIQVSAPQLTSMSIVAQ